MQNNSELKKQKNILYLFVILSLFINLLFLSLMIKERIGSDYKNRKSDKIFLDLSKINIKIPKLVIPKDISDGSQLDGENNDSEATQQLMPPVNEPNIQNNLCDKSHIKALNKQESCEPTNLNKQVNNKEVQKTNEEEISGQPEKYTELSAEELRKFALANISAGLISSAPGSLNTVKKEVKEKRLLKITNELLKENAIKHDLNIIAKGDSDKLTFEGQVFMQYVEKIMQKTVNDIVNLCDENLKKQLFYGDEGFCKYLIDINTQGKILKKEYIESFNFSSELLRTFKKYFAKLLYFPKLPIFFKGETFLFYITIERSLKGLRVSLSSNHKV